MLETSVDKEKYRDSNTDCDMPYLSPVFYHPLQYDEMTSRAALEDTEETERLLYGVVREGKLLACAFSDKTVPKRKRKTGQAIRNGDAADGVSDVLMNARSREAAPPQQQQQPVPLPLSGFERTSCEIKKRGNEEEEEEEGRKTERQSDHLLNSNELSSVELLDTVSSDIDRILSELPEESRSSNNNNKRVTVASFPSHLEEANSDDEREVLGAKMAIDNEVREHDARCINNSGGPVIASGEVPSLESHKGRSNELEKVSEKRTRVDDGIQKKLKLKGFRKTITNATTSPPRTSVSQVQKHTVIVVNAYGVQNGLGAAIPDGSERTQHQVLHVGRGYSPPSSRKTVEIEERSPSLQKSYPAAATAGVYITGKGKQTTVSTKRKDTTQSQILLNLAEQEENESRRRMISPSPRELLEAVRNTTMRAAGGRQGTPNRTPTPSTPSAPRSRSRNGVGNRVRGIATTTTMPVVSRSHLLEVMEGKAAVRDALEKMEAVKMEEIRRVQRARSQSSHRQRKL